MEAQQSKPSFCEWFDPDNIKHIKAYFHLQNTGAWPEGFVPIDRHMEMGWQAILAFKLANKWIEMKLRENDLI